MSSVNVLPNAYALGIMGAKSQYEGLSGFGGPNINLILNNPRFAELDRKESYFACTQHNHKVFDFDGRMIAQGSISNPLLITDAATHFIPLRQRRPSAPYRLAKKIIRSFTNLLFSEKRAPNVIVQGDKESQDFLQCIVDEGNLMSKMIKARDLGGATGSVGLSWCFHQGKPRFNVHNAKHCHVNKWIDRDELKPEHVIEMYKFNRDEWNPQKRRVEKVWFWFRRDWLPDMDLVYKEIPVGSNTGDNQPNWIIDEEKSVVHNDGKCHFYWIQNIPSDEIDGESDVDGLYDNFDTLDLLASVLARGGVLNLDPTLVLNVDTELAARRGVRKGSDNALLLEQGESAAYLELTGASIQAGLSLFEALRKQVLEVAECVLPDPDVLAAQGTSSVALKIIFSSMTAKCDILRSQYGTVLVNMLNDIWTIAKSRYGQTVIVMNENGEPEEGSEVLSLPPRIETEMIVDEVTGEETGEMAIIPIERTPGNGGKIVMGWGDYFKPTPTDQQSLVTTFASSSGGKATMSQRSAVAEVAALFNLNPEEEYKRIVQERNQSHQEMGSFFPSNTGGEVSSKDELPEGAEELPPREMPPNVMDEDEPENLIKDPPGPPGE